MEGVALEEAVEAVRRFNRFYTTRMGVLDEGYAGSPFSLTEARVLFELAQRGEATAAELCTLLRLDPGYLSRMLKAFEDRGLVARTADAEDRRRLAVRLTEAGHAAFRPVDARTRAGIAAALAPLSEAEGRTLARAAGEIERLLSGPAAPAPPILRRHGRGDLGWVVQAHARIYGAEQGWGDRFEALVATVAARFLGSHDPASEGCWIAERDGRRLGCVMMVREDATTARLRLLLVDPAARAEGLGRRLVEHCIAFAGDAGYARIVLWTHTILTPARRLYASTGFRLVSSEPHDSFGPTLMGETWVKELTPGAAAAA